jgi:predicted metalloprotease with PDZ domain
MAVQKKTMNVAEFVKWGNEKLLRSNFQENDATQGVGYRKGIMTAIEEVLFSANRYQGYSFIRPHEAEVEGGWGYDDSTGEFVDDTRRRYFIDKIA